MSAGAFHGSLSAGWVASSLPSRIVGRRFMGRSLGLICRPAACHSFAASKNLAQLVANYYTHVQYFMQVFCPRKPLVFPCVLLGEANAPRGRPTNSAASPRLC